MDTNFLVSSLKFVEIRDNHANNAREQVNNDQRWNCFSITLILNISLGLNTLYSFSGESLYKTINKEITIANSDLKKQICQQKIDFFEKEKQYQKLLEMERAKQRKLREEIIALTTAGIKVFESIRDATERGMEVPGDVVGSLIKMCNATIQENNNIKSETNLEDHYYSPENLSLPRNCETTIPCMTVNNISMKDEEFTSRLHSKRANIFPESFEDISKELSLNKSNSEQRDTIVSQRDEQASGDNNTLKLIQAHSMSDAKHGENLNNSANERSTDTSSETNSSAELADQCDAANGEEQYVYERRDMSTIIEETSSHLNNSNFSQTLGRLRSSLHRHQSQSQSCINYSSRDDSHPAVTAITTEDTFARELMFRGRESGFNTAACSTPFREVSKVSIAPKQKHQDNSFKNLVSQDVKRIMSQIKKSDTEFSRTKRNSLSTVLYDDSGMDNTITVSESRSSRPRRKAAPKKLIEPKLNTKMRRD